MFKPTGCMREYILQSPKLVEELLSSDFSASEVKALEILEKNVNKNIVITGCGTSYNLSVMLERLLGVYCGIQATAVPSLDLLCYRTNLLKNPLVIAVSHSGATKASVEVLQKAKDNGAETISITANEESPMAKTADTHIMLFGGWEKSLPKTKSYTVSAIQLMKLVAALGERINYHDRLIVPEAKVLSQAMEKSIADNEDLIKDFAKEYAAKKRFIFLGAGFNWGLANEIALKMRENNYTASMGFDVEEFSHGSVTLLDDETVTFMATHQGPLIARCKDIYNSSKYANSPIVVVGDESVNEFPEADGKIKIQSCGNEAIDSIIYALPLQLLSYHVSWARGVDPDTLRRHDETYDHIETTFIFPPGTH